MKQKSYLIEDVFMCNLIQCFLKSLNPNSTSVSWQAYHKQNFAMLTLKEFRGAYRKLTSYTF